MDKRKMLIPHQYYYPNMNFMEDRNTWKKEQDFTDALGLIKNKRKATIYIHTPFCNSKCAFCGFDKEYNLVEMRDYVDKVLEEILHYGNSVGEKYTIQSIHFGGGTPTLLPAPYLQEILDTVKRSFEFSEETSVDIEGSATTLFKDEIIQFIKENNIDRVSFGVQSFNEEIRKQMNMKATLKDVEYTLKVLKDNNIITFIDLLYGYPDFGVGDLKEIMISDLETAIAYGVDGIEFGQMYPYKNQLEYIVKERGLTLPTSSEIIDMVETGTKIMIESGYAQTTYSGFTKRGKIILETSYFGGIEEMPDCIAIGSGAFGMVNGYKYRNGSYNTYMQESVPCYAQLKKMTQEQIENMQIVGFPKVLTLDKRLLNNPSVMKRFIKKFEVLIKEKMVIETRESYKLTYHGKNYIDNIYWYLLEESEKENLESWLEIAVLEESYA
ncbi:MAG: radical SAM protein [Suipraeoptans sp.]